MNTPSSAFRPQALVSFPFFAFGLVSFVAVIGWIVAQPGLLLETARGARPLAFVHLAILGWLLTFVFGAAYQLIPVIAETRLWSRSMAYAHFVLHVAAVPRMVLALLDGDFAALGRWGAVLVLGVVVGVANLLLTAARRSKWSPDNIGLLFAIFWLTMTVALGVMLALARVGSVVDVAPERLLRLHMACGLVGFFVGTLVSVSFKLVPMFLLAPVRSAGRAWASIALLNLGLAVSVPGLLGEYRWIVAGASMLIAAAVLFFIAEMGVMIARRRRALDWPLRSFFLGLAMLAGVTAVAVVGVVDRLGFAVASPERPDLIVFGAGLFAAFTPCVLGMAGKIVPFLAWQWRYADHIGRFRVPLVADLFNNSLLRWQFVGHAFSCVAVALGVMLQSEEWLRVGMLGLVLAVGAYASNVVLLARHMIRPRLEPLNLGRPSAAPRQISAVPADSVV